MPATALEDVGKFNDVLFAELDVDRFFYSVRPYYKPYRVGRQEYRGANAGDFSGINEIDLLLGLCRGNDPYYSQLLVDKMLFMHPADQESLRDCLRRRSFLDQFLDALDESSEAEWFRRNAARVPPRLRGARTGRRAAPRPARRALHRGAVARRSTRVRLEQVTASGPPLPVLLSALEVLRDLRLAAPREDIASRYADIARLEAAVGTVA